MSFLEEEKDTSDSRSQRESREAALAAASAEVKYANLLCHNAYCDPA